MKVFFADIPPIFRQTSALLAAVVYAAQERSQARSAGIADGYGYTSTEHGFETRRTSQAFKLS